MYLIEDSSFSVQYRRLVTLRVDFQSVPDDVSRDARIRERGRAAALLLGAKSRKTATLLERRDQARTPAGRGGVAHRHMFGCYVFKGVRRDPLAKQFSTSFFSHFFFSLSF